MKHLLLFICPWINITLDFITRLLLNNSYNTILIVINKFTKEKHYILYIIDKNDIIIKTTNYLLLNSI